MTEQPRRILYIDDDEALRLHVTDLLERRGHDVVAAASGSEGVERARAERFDLIVVDHYMPGMDGLATLRALRLNPDCPPVIYVTGSAEIDVALAALKAGAHEYVVKIPGDEFADLLEQAFGHALAAIRMESEKLAAEEALRAANARLEALLREVNHRLGNSLQLVSTMVAMQSRLLDDKAARAALDDTQRRIQAIAQVHRKLYTSNEVESVAMDEYLASIVMQLEDNMASPMARRSIKLDADPMRLHTDKAVSLGIIVNELVSNACKYAYGEHERGEIRVRFAREDPTKFRLTVEDDGSGFDLGAPPRGTGLGSKLISAMAQGLSSELSYEPVSKGCKATLVAPL